MNAIDVRRLYGWELRRSLRSPLLWGLLILIATTFTWGAQVTAQLHQAQSQSIAFLLREEAAAISQTKASTARYAVAAPEPLPYWQDPSDVAGFSQYFLFRHSFKPHLPASALAMGVSDLLPVSQRIRLATPFGVDASYDFHSPRVLAMGSFDLAFGIVHLLPIALILGFVLCVTFERDRGLLRLIAAQRITPRQWLDVRMLALLSVLLPGIGAALLFSLALAAVPFARAWPEILTALGLVLTYSVFWSAIIYAVLSRWPHAWTGIGALVGIWLLLVLALPLLANLVVSTSSPTVAADEVDARRRVDEDIQEQLDTVLRTAVGQSALLAAHAHDPSTLDYSTRLTFIVPEMERRLEPRRALLERQREHQTSVAVWLSLLSPPLGVHASLIDLAGTDLARHHRFERETREFQLELRDLFYTLMHEQVVRPSPRPFPDSYGRFNFTEYDRVPAFLPTDENASQRVTKVLPMIGWLLALTWAVAGASRRALRRWPADL